MTLCGAEGRSAAMAEEGKGGYSGERERRGGARAARGAPGTRGTEEGPEEGGGCGEEAALTAPFPAAEHDDRVGGRGFSGRRKKGRGPFRGKMYSEMNNRNARNRGGPPNVRQRTEEDDGDVAMSDAHDAPRGR